jgi:hypothetical protein
MFFIHGQPPFPDINKTTHCARDFGLNIQHIWSNVWKYIILRYNKKMDKIKPFEKIALQFQISQESAKYFLGRVQKSFKTEKPSHKLIMEFMEAQDFEFLLTPYELAAMMKESGTWPYDLVSEPPAIVDDPDLY